MSRTNATPVDASIVASSSTWWFTTSGQRGPAGRAGQPVAVECGATGVSTSPTLGWSAGAAGTTFNDRVRHQQPAAAGGDRPDLAVVFDRGRLSASTTYFWRVTAVSSGGSAGGATLVVHDRQRRRRRRPRRASGDLRDRRVDAARHLDKVADRRRRGRHQADQPGQRRRRPPRRSANPANYFDAPSRRRPAPAIACGSASIRSATQKWNDSVFVQFSDSVDARQQRRLPHRHHPAAITSEPTGRAPIVKLRLGLAAQRLLAGGQRRRAWFQNTGAHTIRVQIREDGSEIESQS